jgi:hypothetical protein
LRNQNVGGDAIGHWAIAILSRQSLEQTQPRHNIARINESVIRMTENIALDEKEIQEESD